MGLSFSTTVDNGISTVSWYANDTYLMHCNNPECINIIILLSKCYYILLQTGPCPSELTNSYVGSIQDRITVFLINEFYKKYNCSYYEYIDYNYDFVENGESD